MLAGLNQYFNQSSEGGAAVSIFSAMDEVGREYESADSSFQEAKTKKKEEGSSNKKTTGEEEDEDKTDKEKKNFSKLKLPFPWKLHQLLDDMRRDGCEDIASWLPGGKSFRIHKPEQFSKEIMSNYFRQTKFTSFIRQVRKKGAL
jgi:hypothetical protein